MIILIFIAYILIRIYPYLLSVVPRGYDPGLYLYLWNNDLSIPWLKTVYPPLIFYIGKILSLVVKPEVFLVPLSMAIAGLLFWSVYLYTKNRWTMLLLTISAIQYKFWWWYYIKNILAISLIFFYLYFDKKKSNLKYIFPILLPWLHQPTAIIFFIILLLGRKIKPIILFLIAFAVYYLPNYSLTITPFLQPTLSTAGTESGTFYGLNEAIKLMWIYLPLTVYGLYLSFKRRELTMIGVMALVSFLIPLLGLFMSRRFIPFFDIFSIILAGYGAKSLFAQKKVWAIIYTLVCTVFIFDFVYKNSESLIMNDEFQEIKLLSESKNNAYVLVADNEYTPWIYGYSGRKPITPGFGEYDIYWNNDQWNQFWLSDNRNTEIELLKKLPKPIYIYMGDRQRQIKFKPEGECFSRYSWHVFEFVCGV